MALIETNLRAEFILLIDRIIRGSPHENLKKVAFFFFFLIDRRKTTKRVFRGSGGLVVSTESSRL